MFSSYAYGRYQSLVFMSIAFSCASPHIAAFEYNGPKISFEQVYDNPDDNDLKLNYARQQAAAGDLLSAASALEGMLYAQPDWDSARLFYAIVLYELDDRASAMREFGLLNTRPLTPDQRKLLNEYRSGSVTPSGNKPEISGTAQIGFGIDSNAGNALIDSISPISDQSDASFFANGAISASIPIIKSSGTKLRLGARGQTRKHDTYSRSDYDVIGATADISGDFQGMYWSAGAKYDNIYIDGEQYLSQAGPRLSVGTMLSDKIRLTITGASSFQDFEGVSFSPEEFYRSGHDTIISATISKRVDKNLNYGATIAYEDKKAKTDFLEYDSFYVAGNVFKGFENGVYVKGNARYRDISYAAPNLFASPSISQSDGQFTARAAMGTSLNKVGGWFGLEPSPALSRTYIETDVNYMNNSSNINIYDYDNLGAEIKLVWDF